VQSTRLYAFFETFAESLERTGDIHAQSHVRLGVFFAENPQNQPGAKVLRDEVQNFR